MCALKIEMTLCKWWLFVNENNIQLVMRVPSNMRKRQLRGHTDIWYMVHCSDFESEPCMRKKRSICYQSLGKKNKINSRILVLPRCWTTSASMEQLLHLYLATFNHLLLVWPQKHQDILFVKAIQTLHASINPVSQLF